MYSMEVETKENICKEMLSICMAWKLKLKKIYVRKYRVYVCHGS